MEKHTCCWCHWFSGERCTKNWQMVQRGLIRDMVEIDANTHFKCPDFEFSYHQCQLCERRSDETCYAKSRTGSDDYFYHHINYRDMFTECEHREQKKAEATDN